MTSTYISILKVYRENAKTADEMYWCDCMIKSAQAELEQRGDEDKMTYYFAGDYDETGEIRCPKTAELFLALDGFVYEAEHDFNIVQYPIVKKKEEESK